MSNPKLTGFSYSTCWDQPKIQLDWSNDRHHAAFIYPPFGQDEVEEALRRLAMLVAGDDDLKPE